MPNRDLQIDRKVIRMQIKKNMPSRPPSPVSKREIAIQTTMSDDEKKQKNELVKKEKKY